jgi:riboflavin synthase
MFTGITGEVGRVEIVDLIAGTRRLQISAEEIINDLRIGDSIAVSGECLTVMDRSETLRPRPGSGRPSPVLSEAR